ncbi:adenine-specific methyltransferase EcoRI family protein [Gordonia sp. 852002-51296_SCH5728562-b]|uniref:adenine-specific methyltransferase EcoRI family protein n=1 Tax=Gordonia sp. 852002-51296_SCH5728562-b TaxID=1834101 RepID=UPI0007EB0639|nr:adenine-specific methyltransferase EcoRI family protein [Gordonia sp. 852002-51296_SCH5728562-b]OBA39019.1 modification methylase [Gordonia sp. 852002-51296_SCH5728562-b]
MAGNKALSKAQSAKRDEWYTQLVDIEKELRHYRPQFAGQVVLCNCDDPYESNFFKYFAMNFNHLGLKKLIATSFVGSPIMGSQLPLFEAAGMRDAEPTKTAYKVEITAVTDLNEDGAVDLLDVEQLLRSDANVVTPLSGSGDFRSDEVVALLDEADIVVTNPPFSLFKDYLRQLIDHGKKFLVLGDQNHAKHSEIFPYVTQNKLWFGYDNGGTKWFRVPMDYEIATDSRTKIVDGVKFLSMGRIYWYTNLDTTKRHEPLTLYKRYKAAEYPTYVNYPGIEVDKVAEIPFDYDGAMGVPITFLDKYSPEQFEIVGISTQDAEPMKKYAAPEDYAKNGKKVGGTGKLFIPIGDGKYAGVYERILIKRIGDA